MNRRGMQAIGLLVVALIVALVATVWAGETKYATGTSSAALTFGAGGGKSVVKSVYATTDKENGAVKFYVWNQAAKYPPTTAPASGALTVLVSNASYPLTNSDVVVYQHAAGTAVYRSIASATTTSVVLNAALTVAGATGDYIYELTQGGEIVVGFDGAAAGTNDTLVTTGDVFVTPGGSPLYMVLDGTATSKLQATVDKD